jgi:hypothetical protein
VETLVSDRSRFRCPNPPQSSGLGKLDHAAGAQPVFAQDAAPHPIAFVRSVALSGVEFEARQSMKYRSKIDIERLIEAANQGFELRTRKLTRPFCWGLW